jgi:hypothetical protein
MSELAIVSEPFNPAIIRSGTTLVKSNGIGIMCWDGESGKFMTTKELGLLVDRNIQFLE